MEELNKIVDSEKTPDNQTNLKKERTKPAVVRKVKAVVKKTTEPKATAHSTVVADEITISEAEPGNEKKNYIKKVVKAGKKQDPENAETTHKELLSPVNQELAEPDKKEKKKIKIVKKVEKTAEKADKLKMKVKKAKKKGVKPGKIKTLKAKLKKTLEKLKNSLKKFKKATKKIDSQ